MDDAHFPSPALIENSLARINRFMLEMRISLPARRHPTRIKETR